MIERMKRKNLTLLLVVMLVVPTFICLVKMSSIVVASGVEDEYESDDDCHQAKVIRSGQPQNHSIYPIGDQDWLEIRIDFESDVTIETYGSSGDTEIWLYDLKLNLLAFDDNGGQGYFSTISIHLNAGIYYAKIAEKGNDAEISEYYVKVTYAQAFQSTFGGASGDVGYSVQQTSDGGYIIAGETTSYGSGYWDVYLVKVDSSGNMEWQKTYGGADDDVGYSMQQTSDGGYIIAGYTYSYGSGMKDVYLVKVDSSGNMEWQKTYGGSVTDVGMSVQQTLDGGYIIAGYTGNLLSSSDVYVVKVDSSGNMQWQRTFGGASYDGGYSVQRTSDGGYIIAGCSYGSGADDVYLVKVDSSGNMQWNKTYGGHTGDVGKSILQTSDSGYIIAGYTASYGSGYWDVYLVKVDSSGNMQWNRTYGGASEDQGYSVQQTLDGGYIIAGHTGLLLSSDVYVVKVDSNGNVQWQKTYGGPSNDEGYSVQQTSDGGYVITGYTRPYGSEDYDFYLVKTGPSGDSPSYKDEILEEGTTLIPTMVYTILHDPPGDESYSYFRQTKTTSVETTLFGGDGCTVGFEGKVSFLGSGVDTSAEVSVSVSGTSSDTLVTSYTVGYSSSQVNSDPRFIGPGYGDFYFGEAWLLHYRIVNRTYPNGTTAKIMEYGPTRESYFYAAATWIKDHIPEPWRSKLFALNPAHDNFISDDEEEKVTYLEGIIMSGGAPYSYDYTVTGRSKRSFTLEVEMSFEVAWQCGFQILGVGASGRARVEVTFNVGITQETSEERETEIGFQLYDNNGYDTLDVDIYYDKVYGTYLFIAESDTDTTDPIEPYMHQIAVTNVTNSKPVVDQGCTVDINVTATNYGIRTETFDVTVYANTTILTTFTDITLTSRECTTITFTWNTSGFAKGNYTIKAIADTVPDETDTTDNTYIDGWVLINMHPETPSTPSGPTSGWKYETCTYTTSTTDPDGDSIHYQFDWGDGSRTWTGWYASGEIASASHYWSSQGTYYVKVRAQDSNDAWSDWSSSLQVTIIPGYGGCPYVSTWNGTHYVIDNNLLPTSKANSGTDVEDYYKLEQMLTPLYEDKHFSWYSLQISEFENEHSYLDKVKFLAVDHDSDVNIAVTPSGEILTYRDPLAPLSCIDNYGDDMLSEIGTMDGNISDPSTYFYGERDDYLILNFGQVNADNAKLILRSDMPCKEIPWCCIEVQVLNNSEWQTVDVLAPRVYWSTEAVNLTSYVIAGQDLTVRLYWTLPHRLDYVGLDTTPQADITIRHSLLVSAIHSEEGRVTSRLLFNDEIYSELIPNQNITLTFILLKETAEARTFIFYTEGYYYTITP